MDDPSRWSDPRGAAPREIQQLLAAARSLPPPLPEGVRSASALAVAGLGGAAKTASWWVALKAFAALSAVGVIGVSVAHRTRRPPDNSAVLRVIARPAESPRDGATMPSRPALPAEDTARPTEPPTVVSEPRHRPVANDHHRDQEADAATLERARQLLGSGETALARVILRDQARRFPRSALAEERDYLLLRALVRDATPSAVDHEAGRFLRRHPHGIYSSQVRALQQPSE